MRDNERRQPLAILAVLSAILFASAWPAGAGARSLVVRDAALILTMDPALGAGPLGIVRDSDVVIEDQRIVAVGSGDRDGESIDARGMIVMPGFVDTHNHLWQSLIRGCGLSEDLHGWLDQCMWPVVAALKAEDSYALVSLSAADLVDTGVTTTTDWSIAPSREMVAGNIRALEESGLRFVFAYFDWDCSVDDCSRAAATREAIIAFKKAHIDPNPLARLQIAAHPIPHLAPSVRNMSRLAREFGLTLNVHYMENRNDPHGDVNGMHPGMTEILAAAGAFDGSLLVNHAVHLSDAEISNLAAHGVRVAHNPLSNMRLASGVMRLPEMRAAGIKIGLGFDGGANDTSDAFNLMRVAVGLQRATHLDAAVYPGVTDVLRMMTLGGAEVLGLDADTGSLTPGKQADLIIIDPHQLNFAPDWDWINQIVFNGQPRNVRDVMVAGRILKRDGRTLVDRPALVAAAEAARLRVQARLARR